MSSLSLLLSDIKHTPNGSSQSRRASTSFYILLFIQVLCLYQYFYHTSTPLSYLSISQIAFLSYHDLQFHSHKFSLQTLHSFFSILSNPHTKCSSPDLTCTSVHTATLVSTTLFDWCHTPISSRLSQITCLYMT